MSISEDNQYNFLSKPDEQTYLIDNANSHTSSHLYPPTYFSRNAFSHSPIQKIPVKRTQHRSLSAKNEQSSSLFIASPNPSNSDPQNQLSPGKVSTQNLCNRSLSVDGVSNSRAPEEESCDSSYMNLTWWTTKFSNEGFPIEPSNIDALTVPIIPNQQSPLPAAIGPIHLRTRAHKMTPYQNAFSSLSPIQPRPFNKSHDNSPGNQVDRVVPFTPKSSSDEMWKPVLSKENRFKRTAEALHKSGLWDIAMKTGHLIKRNQELQKELEQFKMDALNFLKSVIKNPENRDFIKSVLNSALCAGAAESKKSVMTVVVSAAAAVAAVSVSESMVRSKHMKEQSPSDVLSTGGNLSLSKDEFLSDNRTSVA